MTHEREPVIVEAVRRAKTDRSGLRLFGHDTKHAMLREVLAKRTLPLAELAGITLNVTQEGLVAAGAGTSMPALEASLAAAGYHLAFEPPDLTYLLGGLPLPPTLGGTISTNLAGPRRIVAGAARDAVVALRAVNGLGEVIRANGNGEGNGNGHGGGAAAGLDLCRLLTGSHGTLAALTEITLRAVRAPETSATLLLPTPDATGAVEAMSASLDPAYGITGAAFLPAPEAARTRLGSEAATLLRIEGTMAEINERLPLLYRLFDGIELIEDRESRRIWEAIRDARPIGEVASEEAVWRVLVRAANGAAILDALKPRGIAGYLDWGGGLAWLVGPGTIDMHRLVARAARSLGGSWMLMRGPPHMRRIVDVTPPDAKARASIYARVKKAFDPEGIMNPGRLG